MAVLVPQLGEAVPSHVGEVIPGAASLWPAFVPRDDRAEARSTTLPYVVVLLVLFSAYGVALRAVAGRSSRLLEIGVFGTGAIFLILLATSPVMLANDVYSYAAYGRMFALSGKDPARELTRLPPDDPYTKLWGEHLPPSSYGPVWTLISGGVAPLVGKRVGLTVLLYRGIAVLAVLGAAALIAICLRRMAPARLAQGVLFFLWNPLVILESPLSAHNDAFMVALFLAGIALHLQGRRFGAMVLFALSALVKFATAPLIPIYLVMVLRQLPDWRARRWFLVQAAAVGLLAMTITVLPFQFGSSGQPASAESGAEPSKPFGWWVFEQNYINSPHELLFRAMRIGMGEQPDDVHDVEFSGWWVAPTQPTSLQPTPQVNGSPVEPVTRGTPLLVIQPRANDSWLRVYDPETKKKGYVLEEHTDAIQRPALAEQDPVLLRWEMGRSPTAQRADVVLKLAAWSLFGLVWLAALVYARDTHRFLLAATALLLASYWLINTAFYAWYVIWALALAALVPASGPALLAALLSATTLAIYATTGFDVNGDPLEWIFTYRSLLFLGLPFVLFALARATSLWRIGSSRAFPPAPSSVSS